MIFNEYINTDFDTSIEYSNAMLDRRLLVVYLIRAELSEGKA